MTREQLKKASELEAQAKAIRRAEKAFWSDILERSDEVVAFLKSKGKLSDTSEEEDYSHVSDKNVEVLDDDDIFTGESRGVG